jgi:hypothetical protein
MTWLSNRRINRARSAIFSDLNSSAFVYVLIAVSVVITLGCNSSKTQKSSEQKVVTTAATTSGRADIDLNCVSRHIQNPPESFHYSFTDASDNPWQEDAEVTPQNIDGTFMNNSLPKPQEFHGPPQTVSSNLMAIGRMADKFATVHGTAAVRSEGTENKNGYDTVKLSIDTSRGSLTEQGLFRTLLGASGFEKGTVWVTSEGCPVQIVLDQQLQARNGSVSKSHYEEAMVKKP